MNIDINNIYKLCYFNQCEVDKIHEVFDKIADSNGTVTFEKFITTFKIDCCSIISQYFLRFKTINYDQFAILVCSLGFLRIEQSLPILMLILSVNYENKINLDNAITILKDFSTTEYVEEFKNKKKEVFPIEYKYFKHYIKTHPKCLENYEILRLKIGYIFFPIMHRLQEIYHRREKIVIKYKLNNIVPTQIIQNIDDELDKEDEENELNLTTPIIRPRDSVNLVKYPNESYCEIFSRMINKDPYPYKYDYEMNIDDEQNVLNLIYKQMSIVFLFFQPTVVKRENPFIESIKRDGETFTVTSPETIMNRNREKQLANQPSRNRSLVTSLSTSDMEGGGCSSSSLNHKINGIHMIRHHDSLLNDSNQSFNQSRPISNSIDGIHIVVKPSSLHINSNLLSANPSTVDCHSINTKTVVPEICSSVDS